MKTFCLRFLILIFTFPALTGNLNSTPSENFSSINSTLDFLPLPFIKSQTKLNGNNVDTWFQNTGTLNQDIRVTNSPGLMWPKGSSRFAVFTSGLSIGAFVNGSVRQAAASYAGEYAPGYVLNGIALTDSRFRIYSVKKGDNPISNPDYASWTDMIPFGAPYDDVNNNGSYEPGIDIPGIKNAAQTIFLCMTDGFRERHSVGEGFGGGTAPLFAEVHVTAWCYDSDPLKDVQFINWVVINKSSFNWERAYFTFVSDVDLGDASDDYIGSDTLRELGYGYNADNTDGFGNPPSYGINPPAVGTGFLNSATIYTGNQNDFVLRTIPPGSSNTIIKRGYRELGMSSIVHFGSGPICEDDPSTPMEAYNLGMGLKKDRTPWINPENLSRTRICYPGDPATISGWSERGTNGDPNRARVWNCGGALIGPIQNSPPGDRRYLMSSGDSLLTVAPGDTQNIVMSQLIARGFSNLGSITRLRKLTDVTRAQYLSDYASNPVLPLPNVNANTKEIGNKGRSEITITWDNSSESYLILDTLTQSVSDSSYLKFEGYQIVELSRFTDSIPDFNKPTTVTDKIRLLKIYDIIDTIGAVIDTLPSGITINGIEQLLPYFVVPFNTALAPAGFPNTGIFRSLSLTKTAFPEEHNGNSDFISGHQYKFAVIPYAYRTNAQVKEERKIIFGNGMGSIISVIPQASLAGSDFTLHNGDTLNTNRKDLGVMPIIIDQNVLKTALYRVVFNSPDTSYNILRSENKGITFDTISKNKKYYNAPLGVSAPDDSSVLIDGILFKVQKMLNKGVIRDSTVSRDSTQARYNGWQYLPFENRYLKSVDSLGAGLGSFSRPFQSRMMGISFPGARTYSGMGSVLPAERLKKIVIEFSDTADGQKAYRYLNRSLLPPEDPSFVPFIIRTGPQFYYQDMRKVPFKVYEITDASDSTAPNKRQINCAFLETNDSLFATVNGQRVEVGKGKIDGKWDPTTFKTGGLEHLYIFNSDYSDSANSFYTTKNLRTQQNTFDIMYVWCPKKINSASNFKSGDKFYIYPYTVTRPVQATGTELSYEVSSIAPTLGNSELASTRNDLEKIRAVPNPFYGFNDAQVIENRYITFTRLPVTCTIKIFTLSGNIVEKISKANDESFVIWDLKNFDNGNLASGVYIALIEAPGIGEKFIKLAVFTSE
ncbi:MAG: hypothetical protein SGI89_01060 [bacterium]|nr:hypothetical protein [bacterium]